MQDKVREKRSQLNSKAISTTKSLYNIVIPFPKSSNPVARDTFIADQKVTEARAALLVGRSTNPDPFNTLLQRCRHGIEPNKTDLSENEKAYVFAVVSYYLNGNRGLTMALATPIMANYAPRPEPTPPTLGAGFNFQD
ncbi:hypothetical protein HDU99_004923 [Rhizoclosmatium hyalinum]|nr:hypothetical protein HDU99_004923 [Rhizoclosmatium hyalinum]